MNLKFQKLYFKSLKNQKFKFTFKKNHFPIHGSFQKHREDPFNNKNKNKKTHIQFLKMIKKSQNLISKFNSKSLFSSYVLLSLSSSSSLDLATSCQFPTPKFILYINIVQNIIAIQSPPNDFDDLLSLSLVDHTLVHPQHSLARFKPNNHIQHLSNQYI
jgi:hypothetical protein